MNKKTIITMCIIGITPIMQINAQNGINSPYSRYAFGVLADRSMGFNKGMAGVAQGMRGGQIINPSNPASYSAVDSLSALFDMGLTLQNGNYKMGNVQQNARNTSLDYMAFHFRAFKRVGMAMGILPYSKINYNMTSGTGHVGGTDDVTTTYTFTGEGGLHQAFIGVGWQPVRPLSIGVNGSYLFGNYSHTTSMTFSESSIYSIARGYTSDITTWTTDFGLQYIQPLGKDRKLTLGFTYGLGHDIKNKAIRYTQTINASTYETEGITGDTIHNAFQLPHTFSAGLAYQQGTKLTIGADFELQQWSKCKFPTQDNTSGSYISTTGQLNDKIRISAGAAYTPDARSQQFLKHSTYKIGGFFGQSYSNADVTGQLNSKAHEFGVTAGISIPITNRYIWYNNHPRLNVTVQWTNCNIPYISNVGNSISKHTLKENYLKLSIGLTFNERWFHKFKME